MGPAGVGMVVCGGGAAFHAKAVVIDRRKAFAGPANATGKGLRDGGLCLQLRGPPVLGGLQFLMKERDGGEELERGSLVWWSDATVWINAGMCSI